MGLFLNDIGLSLLHLDAFLLVQDYLLVLILLQRDEKILIVYLPV